MTQKVEYTAYGQIAVIKLNNPPVNALDHETRLNLQQAYHQALQDDAVKAIVLGSTGKLFCGGADIREFGTKIAWAAPSLPDLCNELEASSKPLIVAINGTAVGGGLEIALSCDYRVSTRDAKLGLPEVNIGLIPGAGGTQRLPRLANVKLSVEMITSGGPITATKAHEAGLVDQIAEDGLLEAAINFAHQVLKQEAPLRTCAEIDVETTGLPQGFFSEFRASIARKTRGFLAPEYCIQAVEAACELPLEKGLEKERELFNQCLESSEARAQQHLFFAERNATKVPDVDPATSPRTVNKVAIIGAGTMGGGIAMNFINAGIPVRLLELKEEALQKGLAVIRKNYEISAQKGRLSAEDVEQRMSLISGTLDYSDLADTDLVIEAAFESMEVKRAVFTQLDTYCKSGAILASNTSTLDIDQIASFTSRPRDVIGLHFFSPANVMRLLEIVRGAKTADDVVVTALNIAKKIRKTPVVVGVCFGFVGNRMLEPYAREAHRLVLEGANPAQIDGVLTDFGMAMGPLSMYDLAGIDIGYLVRESRRDAISHDPSYALIGDRLYALGRYGQKTGRGFYIYEGREKHEDPEVLELAKEIADELGIQQREISDQEILERCIYMLINEGADIVEEGIASRSSDCDIVWINGYGFPAWRGGPMQYADEIGPETVLKAIQHYRQSLGSYGDMWFQPSELLKNTVEKGQNFSLINK
ncbi:3-hydroxyacyl-CoA dehydrogenase NAD-binding domain-containing protein [Marinobacter salexigens]|uniref:Enoyl-CoA hydratase/isomerase family protein n=1 Tax=Marinobacter salexigens TaxID=1925763 RepID=A0ABS6A916_9GAMM|nr:3-hydroxyacyl-CoA dehydrogenase NAD-binding domain-containing protein [Marinobacter salexigens]MBU2874677.1 enoyl-CoA hydratase/isomerase family protein [Marinobacter salexigens]